MGQGIGRARGGRDPTECGDLKGLPGGKEILPGISEGRWGQGRAQGGGQVSVPQVLAGRPEMGSELCQSPRAVPLQGLGNWPRTCSSGRPSTVGPSVPGTVLRGRAGTRLSPVPVGGEQPGSQQVALRSGPLPLFLLRGTSADDSLKRGAGESLPTGVEGGPCCSGSRSWSRGARLGPGASVPLLATPLYLLYLLASGRPSRNSQLASLLCLQWCWCVFPSRLGPSDT